MMRTNADGLDEMRATEKEQLALAISLLKTSPLWEVMKARGLIRGVEPKEGKADE